MAEVETVRGPGDVGSLGQVLMHEHLFTISTELRQNYPDYPDHWDKDTGSPTRWPSSRSAPRTASRPSSIRRCSVSGATPRGCSASTSRWTSTSSLLGHLHLPRRAAVSLRGSWPGLRPAGADGRAVREVHPRRHRRHKVKAGLPRCAIDEDGRTPGVERVLRGVGRVHMETGTPIPVHTSAHLRPGLIVQKVLREEGVDLSRVVIGHCGGTADPTTCPRSPTRARSSAWTGSASTSSCRSRSGSTLSPR